MIGTLTLSGRSQVLHGFSQSGSEKITKDCPDCLRFQESEKANSLLAEKSPTPDAMYTTRASIAHLIPRHDFSTSGGPSNPDGKPPVFARDYYDYSVPAGAGIGAVLTSLLVAFRIRNSRQGRVSNLQK